MVKDKTHHPMIVAESYIQSWFTNSYNRRFAYLCMMLLEFGIEKHDANFMTLFFGANNNKMAAIRISDIGNGTIYRLAM